MAKKTKRIRRHKNNEDMNLGNIGMALDLMLAGHDTVVSPDFLLTRSGPFNADIGHLSPKDLRTFDQAFVDTLVNLKAKQTVTIPEDLKKLCKTYMEQRKQLSEYHDKATDLLLNHDVESAKELGNFDRFLDKVVIRNEAELNVFYDYISLYRKFSGKRVIAHWGSENPKSISEKNKVVVKAFEKAKFAILRLDKNLEHGAIKTTNLITQNECVLVDRALNESKREGYFFICSILDMENYVMTSGCGTPIDPTSDTGKSTLTLLKKHLDKLRTAKSPLNNDIIKCVREMFGFCLRGGALKYMTMK